MKLYCKQIRERVQRLYAAFRKCLECSKLMERPGWQMRKRCSGQATVEYLIVGAALIVIISALGVFSGRLGEGLYVEHAAESASHAITTNTAGSAGDVLLY